MAEKTLSIFIDESGDFGSYETYAPYYIVSLVFHDQSVDITRNISIYEDHLAHLGYPNHVVHTGPLIRREQGYANLYTEDRKRLFSALFNFTRRLDIRYSSVIVSKRECRDEIELTSRISKQLGKILDEHYAFFHAFDSVIVYYDNGQINLTRIISSVFSSHLTNVSFRKVKPVDYRLLQVADLLCTTELLAEKMSASGFSQSEYAFFDSPRNFRKTYLKWLLKKHLS